MMENKRTPNRLRIHCAVKEQMNNCKSVIWPKREMDDTRLNPQRMEKLSYN